MMNELSEKFFKMSLATNNWKLKQIDEFNYCFSKVTNNEENYNINVAYFQGVEQISTNEFLLAIRNANGTKGIRRIKLNDGKIEESYNKMCFSKCYQLNDDIMLFVEQNLTSYQSIFQEKRYTAYSIKKNKELKQFEWLSTGFDISAIDLSNDKSKNNIVLFAIKKLESKYGDDYIQFRVNTKTFQPIDLLHSTLRENYIKVETKDDVLKIIDEDKKYKQIVDWYFSGDNSRDTATKKILSK